MAMVSVAIVSRAHLLGHALHAGHRRARHLVRVRVRARIGARARARVRGWGWGWG